MKLRKLLIIIMVAGLLVVYYVFGTDYREQRHINAVLTAQISSAAQQLALIPPPPTGLDQVLSAANTSLSQELNTFPALMNSTQIVNAILKLAETAGVKAVPLVTQPWAKEHVNQTDYTVFRLNIAVKATFTQLADFLSRLENGEPGTMVISNLKVDRVIGPPANVAEPGDAIQIEGSLDIGVYTRPIVTAKLDKVE